MVMVRGLAADRSWWKMEVGGGSERLISRIRSICVRSDVGGERIRTQIGSLNEQIEASNNNKRLISSVHGAHRGSGE